MNLKLFGPRVMLEKVKPPQKGTLLVPESPNAIYSMARVTHVGDGRQRQFDGTVKTVPLRVKEGDIVYFQTNAVMAAACSYELDGKSYMNLLQDDLLARLPDADVTVEKMEMLGDWTLVEPYIRQTGTIIMPDTINYQEHLEHTYWKLVKAAPASALEVRPGQEVLLNAHRASPLQINGRVYCCIDSNFILGVREGADETVSGLPVG